MTSEPRDAQSVEFNAALGIALKSLSGTDKFTAEIRQSLENKGVDSQTSEEVIAHLLMRNILNDLRCAKAVIEASIGKKTVGKRRLYDKLLLRGAPDEIVEELLNQASDETDRMTELIASRPSSGATYERSARLLLSRGFEPDDVEEFLTARLPTEPRD